jgi:hypothetical protein
VIEGITEHENWQGKHPGETIPAPVREQIATQIAETSLIDFGYLAGPIKGKWFTTADLLDAAPPTVNKRNERDEASKKGGKKT